jgi:hypothetical protein
MDQDTCYSKGTEAIQLPITLTGGGFAAWQPLLTKCVGSHIQMARLGLHHLSDDRPAE